MYQQRFGTKKIVFAAIILLLFIGISAVLFFGNSPKQKEVGSTVKTTSFTVASGKKYQAINACTLISAEQLSGITGLEMTSDVQFYADSLSSSDGKPIVSKDSAFSTCAYLGKETGMPQIQIGVISPGSDSDTTRSKFDEAKAAAKPDEYYQELQGYGETAFWSDADAVLWMYKNQHVLKITIANAEDADVALTEAKAATNIVAPKL